MIVKHPSPGDKILIFRPQFLQLIFGGAKTLEIRAAPYRSGTYYFGSRGQIYGQAKLGRAYRATPEVVGTKSALCYAKQTGVLPLALRLGENGDWEIANIFIAGPCAITNWHRHRAVTRASTRMVGSLVAAFRHVTFWRRET